MPASPGPLACAFAVSSALLLLLAGKKAPQQKQAPYQSFPGDLQLLRNPSGQTTSVNILLANSRAAQGPSSVRVVTVASLAIPWYAFVTLEFCDASV